MYNTLHFENTKKKGNQEMLKKKTKQKMRKSGSTQDFQTLPSPIIDQTMQPHSLYALPGSWQTLLWFLQLALLFLPDTL